MRVRFSSDGEKAFQVVYLDSQLTPQEREKITMSIMFLQKIIPFSNVEETVNEVLDIIDQKWKELEDRQDRDEIRGTVIFFLYTPEKNGKISLKHRSVLIPKKLSITYKEMNTMVSCHFLLDYIKDLMEADKERFEREVGAIGIVLAGINKLMREKNVGVEIDGFGVIEKEADISKYVFEAGNPIGSMTFFRFSSDIPVEKISEEIINKTQPAILSSLKEQIEEDIKDFFSKNQKNEMGVMVFIGSRPVSTPKGPILPINFLFFPIENFRDIKKEAELFIDNKEVLDKLISFLELFYSAMRILAIEERNVEKEIRSLVSSKWKNRRYYN